MWWYAVLNLEDYNVFVSTFTHEYDEGGREGGRDEQVEHRTNVAMKRGRGGRWEGWSCCSSFVHL